MNEKSKETLEAESGNLVPSARVNRLGLRKMRWYRGWHRKLAILALLPILWFAITGILLNHTQDLKLAAQPLKGFWLKAYGVAAPEGRHYKAHDRIWSVSGLKFYLDGSPVAECSDGAVAAVNINPTPGGVAPNLMALVCQSQIQIVDETAALVESLASPLNQPIEAAALVGDDQLGLIAADNSYVFDLMSLQLEPMSADNSKAIRAATNSLSINSSELPPEIKTRFDESLSVPGLNAERLVQDLHALRFLPAGKWLLDLSAVLMVLLSVTGLMLLKRTRAPR